MLLYFLCGYAQSCAFISVIELPRIPAYCPKEQHGFRYTQYVGKARMEMKAGLTFACMNLKKLAKILEKRDWNTARFLLILKEIKRKEVLKEKWCWI